MKSIRVALAGNPNSGKSTIFNKLTGSNQHIGNWPGVTVEKKEGHFDFQNTRIIITDLPGTYSLTPYSLDEKIARDFIVNEKPDLVIAVIDSSDLEKNLYLAIELLELDINLIIDLNMTDITQKLGVQIDTDLLSKVMNCPVIQTVANKGKGLDDLKSTILNYTSDKIRKFNIDYGHDIENSSNYIIEKLDDLPSKYPARYFSIKLIEGDEEILEEIENPEKQKLIKEEINQLEKHLGFDPETAIIEQRHGFIEGLIKESISKKISIHERHSISDKIDLVLTNRYIGLPIFFVIIWLIFHFIFTIGNPIANYIEIGINFFNNSAYKILISFGIPKWISSLLTNGIISGVGAVLTYLPNILLLFFAISFLEDTGYMARAAFIVDRIMHIFGLHGKSFIPMILGFGCNIPAVLATRTLESKKDRILTILIIPLMSCSARLPVYILFTGIFFKENQGLIVFSLYFLGIIISIFVARFFKNIFFRYEAPPLIMELPPYRLPQIQRSIVHMWERGKVFIKKAGTVIVSGVIIIWILANLPFGVEYASKQSLIGQIGSFISPVFEPAGFGQWQISVSLIMGIVAKEIIVGTLGTLYGAVQIPLKEALLSVFTPLSAYAFLVMSLLYIPCIGTIAAIKKEAGWKWAFLATSYTIILGWLVAVIIYQIGSILT